MLVLLYSVATRKSREVGVLVSGRAQGPGRRLYNADCVTWHTAFEERLSSVGPAGCHVGFEVSGPSRRRFPKPQGLEPLPEFCLSVTLKRLRTLS